MISRRQVLPSFWTGKRVFLTGHTGFKGSWLVCWLSSMGARVSGYALAPETDPAMFNALNLRDRLDTHEIGDVRDAAAVARAVRAAAPDVVIHMAAQPIVSVGYDDPVGTFATNAMGTAHVLQACRELPASACVLVVSSDKCYLQRGHGQPFREGDPLGGDDPYSASKAATEIVAHAYRMSYFSKDGSPRLASGRAGNVIGGGDWSLNRLLPDLAQAFSRGEAATIRNPMATRPWQHVIEPLSGYLVLLQALAENPAFAQGWNFGPAADCVSVEEVVRHAVRAWGGGASVQMSSTPQDWKEAKTLDLDCGEADRRLGWRGVFGIEKTIAMTMDWYKIFYKSMSSQEMADFTLLQIEEYMQHART